jgi:predicted permease
MPPVPLTGNEERRQFRILYRDFLFRILDLELLASRGEAQRLLTQFAALLAAFSFTFSIYFVPRYGLSNLPWEKLSQLGWVDQDLLIATTMAIAGMFTVLAWNNVLPDRRDCLIFGLLPVRTRTIFLAKLAALATALGVAIAALNIFSGIAYPFAIAAPGGGAMAVLRAFAAYWTAMLAAGLAVCCALLAVQALAANLLTYRLFLKLSSVLQMAAFFAILGLYFLKPPYRQGLTWVPSFWFLGLFQKLNGTPGFDSLAARALDVLAAVCPLALVAFSLAFVRHNRRIVEQPDIAPSDRSRPAMRLVSWFAAKLIPRTVERAVLLFTARTIARSRHHRLLLAAYGGIGLAVALAYARDLLYGAHSYERLWSNPQWNRPNPELLVGSLTMLFFAMIGARAVFSQPIALRSNWIFRLTAVQRAANYFAAVRKSLFALIAVPVLAAWSALFFAIWPANPAARHIVFLAAAALLMAQLLLARFRKIPFACSYLPGKANLHVKLGLYAIGFLFVTSLAIELEYKALGNARTYVILLGILLAWTLWAYRRNVSAADDEILFDEVPPSEIESLNLRDRGPRGGKPVILPPPEIPRTPFSLEQFFHDLAGAARILTRSPGLSLAVVALIAVGIGGNAAIYSMVHAVLSKKAPGITADNLVSFGSVRNGRLTDPGDHSYPEYLAYATRSRTMQSVAAMGVEFFNMALPDGASARLRGQLLTSNYFRTIGVSPVLGREFTAEEARGAAPLVAVIASHVWQNQFHQRADILGQSVLLNGLPATVVGVMPPRFHGTTFAPNLEIAVPIVTYMRSRGTEENLADPEVRGIGIIGRLAPNASVEAAQREFDDLATLLQSAFPDAEKSKKSILAPYTATAFGPNSGPQRRMFFNLLMVLALLTLLVVCANVANLLLARSVAREREIALRLSLGAPRSRILRTLLAEGLLLSVVAAAAALAFAAWATHAITALFPPLASGARFDVDLAPDWRVGAYAVLLAVLCTVAFSLAPAWRAWRQDLLGSLKRGEHGIVSGRSKMASVLMVAQLAMCVVLLTGGGLAWRSLSLMNAADLGFPRSGLLLANVSTADGADLERVRQNLAAVPGVESASWTIAAPPDSHPWRSIPARATDGGPEIPTEGTHVGPDYLRTLGVPILEGGENWHGASAVINRKLAQALWPGQSAVGHTFILGTNTTPLRVTGVVPDGAFCAVADDGSSELAAADRRPFVFVSDAYVVPAGQDRAFHIRYRGPLGDLVPAVTAAIHRADSRLTVFGIRTMQAEWERFTSPVRVLVMLVACFALGGLFVASVGLYAVVAFYTGKRTRELGIRAALGASPAQAARLIVREGFLLTALGLALGLAICGIAGKAVAHLLFGVTPTDTVTWISVIALLTAVSLAASWLPARRAAKVDPMMALRQD